MSGKSVYSVSCCKCGRSIGELNFEEYTSWYNDEGDRGLCFYCESDSAALTPSIFWQWQDGDRFEVDGVSFTVQLNRLVNYPPSHVRAHERTRARGLSSYTYLNRTIKKGEFWDYEALYEVCQECCGYGSYLSGNDRVDCEKCGGEGVRVKAILLPRWILGLGCENV